MSQQPLVNGPAVDFNTHKDEVKDMPKAQPIGNGSQPPFPSGGPLETTQRPLSRSDSRTNFQFRPPFPTQSQPTGQPPRPQQFRPPGPQQFPPRTPIPGQRPPGISPTQGPPSVQPFPGNQQRANFRPYSPFPRPSVPGQRPPGIFQQRSVPAFGNVRPQIPEEGIIRSQTLDSSDVELPKNDDNFKNSHDHVKTPSIAAMNNRSYSLSSNPQEVTLESKEEARRRSVSSVDSYGEGRPTSRPSSRQGLSESNENLDKKQEEIPSRPESRSTSRMNKIVEDEDKSPSSLTDVSQRSVELSPNESSNSNNVNKNVEIASKPPTETNSTSNKEGPSKTDKHLDLNKSPKTKPSKKSEGDNDSGVDESTQGNDTSNGGNRSPRKSSKSRVSSATPNRSLSRGSKSPSLKSPDSNATTPGSISEKKKVPMNKIQVGHAPSPNLKVVRSKVGSLENASYKPGGGHVKIENKKIEIKATPRIEAKNDKYVPKGGEKKIISQKLQWTAKSKIGSLENTTHKPKGGDKKIESMKLDFKGKAKPKVGSKDNIKHIPGGGDVKEEILLDKKNDIAGKTSNAKNGNSSKKDDNFGKTDNCNKIETKKIDLKVQSKIGSLDNVKHRPGGGEKKIFDDKEYLRQMSSVSSIEHSLSASQNSLPSQPDKVPVADENLNQER